jgi:FAD/FMN-containing dehydrogenase
VTATLDTVVPTTASPVEELRTRIAGSVVEPCDDAYAAHATPWNLAVPMAPAAVVVPACAEDVAETVRVARAAGLTVGVQATGHGAVSSLAGSLLVSTRDLDEVTVHAEERWARVGAGVKWARVIDAASPHGLAPLNGSSSDVGVVGYITGGGVGPMARTFGIAADTVRAIEVVTGDGELRRVTPTEHPDLFWALRGGKGAGGIVTAVEIDLLPLSEFYGGALFFDGADAGAVIDAWRTWSAFLPEQATTSFAILQLPPLPGVPPQLAGRMTLSVRFLWTGDATEGARLLDQLRAVATPIIDDASVRPYAAVDSVHTDPVDPMPSAEASTLLREFPEKAVGRLLALAGPESPSPQVLVEVRQLGGAYARPGRHASAFDHRDARYSLLAVGIPMDPRVAPHQSTLLEAFADLSTGGVWPNFAAPHDAVSAARAYTPQTQARLARIARTYDPDGVLAAGAFARC